MIDLGFLNKVFVFILVILIIGFGFVLLIKYGSNFLCHKTFSNPFEERSENKPVVNINNQNENSIVEVNNFMRLVKRDIDTFKEIVLPSLDPELLEKNLEKYKLRKNIVIDQNVFEEYNAIQDQEKEIEKLRKENMELKLKTYNE